jgi:hypothetical protein
MSVADRATTVIWLAFAIGLVFGAVASGTRFCTMGAVADIANLGDWGRMRMWLLAIALAILGTAALHETGLIDVDRSIYRGHNLTWLSHLAGGLCFGFGMVLASGCGARTLVRIGAGSVKALVVFIVLASRGLHVDARRARRLPGRRCSNPLHCTLPGGQGLPALLANRRAEHPGRAPLPLCAAAARRRPAGCRRFLGRPRLD